MSRFSEPQHPVFQQLNASIGFDWRLGPYDVDLSRAHAKMLAAQGIIGQDDRDALLRALDSVEQELQDGSFPFEPDDEDIHMAIERRITQLAGRVGGKLHTARSRNDQVATDMALFTRAHAQAAQEAIRGLMRALVATAERHLDWRMPGYTHLQRAQPVYLSHHLLAYVWMLARDLEKFAAVEQATARLPLGAGALAGVNFDTDRQLVARELGFAGVAENSIDAVSNRDFVLDYLAAAATCGTHLSRLGAEIVLWSSSEFAFAEVSDAWASGSSIMPQKKNPDAAELLRAKAPRIAGHFVALQGTMHALPLTYNKDMQEDKEHLFDAVDTLELCLAAAAGMIEGIAFDRERMAEAASDEFPAATDVADLLVRRGMPFRECHGVVAGLVKQAVDSGRTLTELTLTEIREQSELLDGEYYEVLRGERWLESKDSEGGTSLRRVREQLDRARALLG
ncbi:argininosuccinate lyase [Conexibacter woesei]|uniref:Argininosuccinate lyase n=1 Tax=Conexibacter woesei (strain DSM 14684 / CCUG 47730 / CIP 108061 / JCM 11494 / NBRC 100937 / ID131577) TaxID=469383 RepID=D3F0A2_CONWI|nr:argininosuccinate lyase [Conexibacter woesei]ADB51962.1 argininosuccinate lyase [Conexibacter woesei DSM 14684]